MKKLIAAMALGLSFTSFAGDKAGNGGGAWVCENQDNSVRWMRLVDLYEAEKEFFLNIKNFEGADYMTIMNEVDKTIATMSPELHGDLSSYMAKVKNNIREVDADLEILEDSLYRVRPPARDCKNGNIYYGQVANYTNYGVVLINDHLFNNEKMSETDKAALLFHEAIYAYLRDKKEVDNSVKARKVVGHLFSELKENEIEKQVKSTLGFVEKAPRSKNKYALAASEAAFKTDLHFCLTDKELESHGNDIEDTFAAWGCSSIIEKAKTEIGARRVKELLEEFVGELKERTQSQENRYRRLFKEADEAFKREYGALFAPKELIGLDQKGNKCSMTVLSETRVRHSGPESERTLNRRGLSNTEVVSKMNVTFKTKRLLFGLKEIKIEGLRTRSLYDTMWNAYEINRAEAQSGSEDNRHLGIEGDMVLRVDYDASGNIKGYTYGEFGDYPEIECNLK